MLVPAISQVYSHTWTSLSAYRQFYGLIPVFLTIGIGINYFYEKNKTLRFGIQGVCNLLIIFQAYQHIVEVRRFNKLVATANCSFQSEELSYRKFRCDISAQVPRYLSEKTSGKSHFEKYQRNFSLFSTEYKDMEEFVLPYRKYADNLAEKIKRYSSNKPIMVNAPSSDFEESKNHLIGYNILPTFLALYLAENGIDVTYYVPYSRRLGFGENILGWTFTRFLATQGSGIRASRHLTYPLKFKNGKYKSQNDNKDWHLHPSSPRQ